MPRAPGGRSNSPRPGSAGGNGASLVGDAIGARRPSPRESPPPPRCQCLPDGARALVHQGSQPVRAHRTDQRKGAPNVPAPRGAANASCRSARPATASSSVRITARLQCGSWIRAPSYGARTPVYNDGRSGRARWIQRCCARSGLELHRHPGCGHRRAHPRPRAGGARPGSPKIRRPRREHPIRHRRAGRATLASRDETRGRRRDRGHPPAGRGGRQVRCAGFNTEHGLTLVDYGRTPARLIRVPVDVLKLTDFALSRDGSTLVVGSTSGLISLWDVTDEGRPVLLHRLIGHASLIHTVEFTSDERHIVSADAEGVIKVWVGPPRRGSVGPHQAPGELLRISFLRTAPPGSRARGGSSAPSM